MLVTEKKIINIEIVFEEEERNNLQGTFDFIDLLIDEFEEREIKWICNDMTGEWIEESDLYKLRDTLDKLLSNTKWEVEKV